MKLFNKKKSDGTEMIGRSMGQETWRRLKKNKGAMMGIAFLILLFPGGLIVSTISERIPNIQVIAAQAADSLLRIENVRMSILIFQLTENTVGLSARSTGELNVQVIMEAFGGGGHQNVAGAQVKDGDIEAIKAKVIEISEKYIEENDKDESDSAAGR